MKICTACKTEKAESEYGKNAAMEDGKSARCMECNRAIIRRHRAKINADPELRAKFLESKRAYGLIHRKSWAAPTPERRHEYMRKWIDSNREKKRAHRTVKKAMDEGRLIPQPCEVCGVTKVEAHHDDYSKRLAVRWLCRIHHKEHHRMEKQKAN